MKKSLFLVTVLMAAVTFSGCARRKKYENPIANDSAQPDKTLWERAVGDLEKSRYEVARLTLQTMINTYPDSEYLAKAKLAIADSWYRQGGTSALAQAEAEYKDFITFFPSMEEAVEAQLKVAMIHYQQMEKADRDITHAKRAEQEFKQLLIQFPDSKFTEEARQRLRETQELLADGEFRVGQQYYHKGSNRSAVMRLKDLADHFPYYSQADSALWLLGQSYERAGKDFTDLAANAYTRIVKDYPLSDHVGDAKSKLKDWKKPIPEPSPEALARMKFDQEHRDSPGKIAQVTGILKKHPDLSAATKSGDPLTVNLPAPPTPAEVTPAAGAATGSVVIQPVEGPAPTGVPVITPGAKPPADSGTKPPESSAPASGAPAPATATPVPGSTDNSVEPQKKKGLFRKLFGGGNKDAKAAKDSKDKKKDQ
jgi:outer membrane protein assembly factor BamD